MNSDHDENRRLGVFQPAGLALLVVFLLGGCTKFFVVLDHNSGLNPIPQTDRMVGEQSRVPAEYTDIIEEANLSIESAVESMQLPAISIAIGLDGELIWSRAIGLRDLDSGEPVTLDTKFRIGSSAKALTGTIAARLVEEGVLDLDASIYELVPYFPQKGHDITTRQLLTHTAGIRAYKGGEYYSKKNHRDVANAVKVFAKSPLEFEPGTRFAYTTYGYVLASAAMEGASGMSFDELVRTKLTQPLELKNTMREGLADGDFAIPYEIREDEYKKTYPANNSNRTAGGGFVSTPSDLIGMTQAIMAGDYLKPSTMDTLFYSPQRLRNGAVNEQDYAIGWRYKPWQRLFSGERDIWMANHFGRAAGGDSFLAMFPDHNLSISIVTNTNVDDKGDIYKLAAPIAERIIQRRERLLEPEGP